MYLGWFCCSACFYAWELCCPTHSTGPMVGTLEARGSWTLTPHQRSGLVFARVFLAFVDSCLSYEAFPDGEQRLVFLVCLLVSLTFQIGSTVSQISEEIKLCEAGECSYLRPQRRGVLRNILVSELSIPDSMAEKINV